MLAQGKRLRKRWRERGGENDGQLEREGWRGASERERKRGQTKLNKTKGGKEIESLGKNFRE